MFLISIFSLIGMVFFKDNITFDISLRIYGLLILKSLIMAIVWLFLYKAYQQLNISLISPLRNLSPIFLVVLSLIFLGENITLINYMGIGLIMVSAYVLEIKLGSSIFKPLKIFKSKFFVYVLISLLGSSISAILDKILLKDIHPYSLLFFFYLFMSIIYLGIVIFKKEVPSVKKLLNGNNLYLILAITLVSLIADITYAIAAAIPATLIVLLIPLRRLSTFISTIVGGKFFKEKNILYKSGICLIMILGIYLIII